VDTGLTVPNFAALSATKNELLRSRGSSANTFFEISQDHPHLFGRKLTERDKSILASPALMLQSSSFADSSFDFHDLDPKHRSLVRSQSIQCLQAPSGMD
jgi:hypothetical protein